MKPVITDKNSPEWVAVRDFCLKRQSELRVENDGELNMGETARLRGMIELTKEILLLDEKKQSIKVDDKTYIE